MASMQIYSAFDYGDEPGIRSFFLENALRHQEYANRISTILGQQVPFFDVSDTNMVNDVLKMMKQKQKERKMPPSLRYWLLDHAALHDAEIKAITTEQNFNLYDTDFTDPSSFFDWLSVHYSLHDYVDAALGV